jgi:hypothetical protein
MLVSLLLVSSMFDLTYSVPLYCKHKKNLIENLTRFVNNNLPFLFCNRQIFEELKSKTPDRLVDDENEPLYYQLRDMFNELTENMYSEGN